jgi:urease accessory protein
LRYSISLTDNQTSEPIDQVQLLKLMRLADSAWPIGGAAHSFGLETMVAEELLTADSLPVFLRDYLEETGVLEAAFCRGAHHTAATDWIELNGLLSARKPAHESRAASLTLGRRFLRLFASLEGGDIPDGESHYATAFGYAGRVLGVGQNLTAAVYLQQTLSALVSACQRLMPLGQQRAARLLWDLTPAILDAAQSGAVGIHAAASFTPLIDIASMRHVALETRLFIS